MMSRESGGQQNREGQVSQSQSGQPQGTQPQNQDGGSANPGIGDILNREDTKDELKFSVALFAVIGIGIGLGGLLFDILEDSPRAEFLLSTVWVIVPLIGALIGLRVSEELADVPDNLVYATAATAALVGTVVFGILTWLFGEIIFDFWVSIGDLIEMWIAFAVAAAVVAAATVAIERKL